VGIITPPQPQLAQAFIPVIPMAPSGITGCINNDYEGNKQVPRKERERMSLAHHERVGYILKSLDSQLVYDGTTKRKV
jgi:hypothetical protein